MDLNTTNITSAVTSTATTTGSGSMYQVGGAPAALAFALANEIIDITMKNMDLFQKIAIAQTKVQQLTTQVAADAQVNAAEAQSWATFTQAMGEIGSAAVSLGGIGAQSFATSALTAETKALQAEMKPLKVLKDYIPEVTAPAQGRAGNLTPPPSRAVADLAAELKTNGAPNNIRLDERNPQNIKPDADTIAALKHLKENDSAGYLKYQKNLNKKIDGINERINANATRIQTMQTQVTQYKDLVNGAAGSISKGIESGYTAESGRDQALQQIASGVKDMANAIVGSANQAVNKADDDAKNTLRAAAEAAKGAYAN
jgi:hypothetical protein